jgi:hypothetical protein
MHLRPMNTRSRTLLLSSLIAIIVAVVGAMLFLPKSVRHHLSSSDRPYTTPPKSFDGKSNDLAATVIVPTLDTPVLDGKNAIWCASFQVAWDRLKNDVAGEPLQVATAEALAARLNASELPSGTLDESSYYAAAGLMKDGIRERIRDEMQRRFQKEPMELASADAAVIAYAYLRASVPFTIPYFENDEPFEFTDSQGRKTRVSSFGLQHKHVGRYHELYDQPQVLHVNFNREPGQWKPPTEYAIDLCRDSKPNQVIVARIPRKETLRATLDDLKQRLAKPPEELPERVGSALLVPNLNWSVYHRFAELEGANKKLLNSKLRGLYLSDAIQTIDFRLDRSGVELESEAGLAATATAFGDCLFDHPFLILVKKRGAEMPIFVMWVDNAELLCQAK